MVAIAATSALLVGFLAGLISFKVKPVVPAVRRDDHRRPARGDHPATPSEYAELVNVADAVLQPGRASGSIHPGSAAPRERWPLMLVPRTSHQPDRPAWDCLACDEPWPCAPGKVEVAERGLVHRRSLRLYLESCAIDMIDDRADGHHASGRDDAITAQETQRAAERAARGAPVARRA